MPIFVAKKDDNYYVCVEMGFIPNDDIKIDDYDFFLHERLLTDKQNPEKITKKLSKEYFKQKVTGKYMGVICDYLTRGEYYDEDEKRNRKYRNKYFFTLTILDEMYPTKTFSKWISLKVAPRRIKKYYINKGIHQAMKVLGVK